MQCGCPRQKVDIILLHILSEFEVLQCRTSAKGWTHMCFIMSNSVMSSKNVRLTPFLSRTATIHYYQYVQVPVAAIPCTCLRPLGGTWLQCSVHWGLQTPGLWTLTTDTWRSDTEPLYWHVQNKQSLMQETLTTVPGWRSGYRDTRSPLLLLP